MRAFCGFEIAPRARLVLVNGWLTGDAFERNAKGVH
jgi:hypothetical protein